MLPGFRFLFAAIVLSMSILIFGLGAVALLRTAHEEFASTPAWYPAPETRIARNSAATQPVLAMLRVDDTPKSEQPAPKAGQPVTDHIPAAAPTEQAASVPAEQAATAPVEQTAATPTEPQPPSDKVAVLQPQDSPSPEATRPEAVTPGTTASENPPQAEAAPLPADAPTSAEATKIAATEQVAPPAHEAAPAISLDAASAAPEVPAPEVSPAPEQASAPTSPNAGSFSTKIATLGGPPVDITAGSKAKAAPPAKPDQIAMKKRAQAMRAARRRRITAARARMARLAAQQPIDPFAQSPITAVQPTITTR
jgi:hypothetical protein